MHTFDSNESMSLSSTARSSGLRVIVQRTFIEVIEVSDGASSDTAKRVRSAPAPASKSSLVLLHSDDSEDADAVRRCSSEAIKSDRERGDQDGPETKTTVVIRNLPLDYTRDRFLELLDSEGFSCQYDFVYLPIEFMSGANFGYAFVNLTSPELAMRFLVHFEGFGDWGVPHIQQAVIGWSWSQGLEQHVERYRNSPVMHESMVDECKPIVLDGGVRVEFPPPTKKLQHLRRLRTRHGSRGRTVPLSFPSGLSSGWLKANRQPLDSMPSVPEDPCPLLAGLRSATSLEDGAPLMTSPLLLGLKYTNTNINEPQAECGRLKSDAEDSEVHSECSTDVPGSSGGPCFGGIMSSMSSAPSDTCSEASAGCSELWFNSMLAEGLVMAPAPAKPALAEGLVAAPPPSRLGSAEAQQTPSSPARSGPPATGSLVEIIGTYPSGEQAVVIGFDPDEGTLQLQLMRNGRPSRRRRTVKCRHARVLRHGVARPADGRDM